MQKKGLRLHRWQVCLPFIVCDIDKRCIRTMEISIIFNVQPKFISFLAFLESKIGIFALKCVRNRTRSKSICRWKLTRFILNLCAVRHLNALFSYGSIAIFFILTVNHQMLTMHFIARSKSLIMRYSGFFLVDVCRFRNGIKWNYIYCIANYSTQMPNFFEKHASTDLLWTLIETRNDQHCRNSDFLLNPLQQ